MLLPEGPDCSLPIRDALLAVRADASCESLETFFGTPEMIGAGGGREWADFDMRSGMSGMLSMRGTDTLDSGEHELADSVRGWDGGGSKRDRPCSAETEGERGIEFGSRNSSSNSVACVSYGLVYSMILT